MKDFESQIEELLVVLAELHGKEMSPAFIVTYKRALLSKLSPEETVEALNLAFTSKTYGFPKPFDLIELVKGRPEDAAFLAWETLNNAIQQLGPNRSVLFSDAKITQVVEAMGGWVEVNNWLVEDLKFRRKEFMKLYQFANCTREPWHLPGLIEIQNTATGFFKNIPEPVRIGEFNSLPGLGGFYGDSRLTGAFQKFLDNMDLEHSPDGLN